MKFFYEYIIISVYNTVKFSYLYKQSNNQTIKQSNNKFIKNIYKIIITNLILKYYI